MKSKITVQLVLYSMGTALSLLLLYWFFTFIAERFNSLSLAILNVATLATITIVLYLVLRWQTSQSLEALIQPSLDELMSQLNSATTGDSPLQKSDLVGVFTEVKKLGPIGLRYIQQYLTFMFLIAITVEILAIAGLGVAYLQAERLREQNALITSERNIAEANLLLELVTKTTEINESKSNILSSTPELKSRLLDPLSIMDDFANTMLADENIVVEENLIDTCQDVEQNICNNLSLGEFGNEFITGNIELSIENIESIKAFYRLSKAAEVMALPILTEFDSEEFVGLEELFNDDDIADLNDLSNRAGNFISETAANCGYLSEKATRLENIWQGYSAVAIGSTEMWQSDDVNMSVNSTLIFQDIARARLDIGILSSGAKLLQSELNQNTSDPIGPVDIALLLQDGLRNLELLINEVIEQCDIRVKELDDSLSVLNYRRSQVLERSLEEIAFSENKQ